MKSTVSPAIDILVPSNLERLLYLITQDSKRVASWYEQLNKEGFFEIDSLTLSKIKEVFVCGFCRDQEILAHIKKTYEEDNVIIDPHTAVGKLIAERLGCKVPTLVAATAHYGKFPEAVIEALAGVDAREVSEDIREQERILGGFIKENHIEYHASLKGISERKVVNSTKADGDIESVKKKILEKLSSLDTN